MSGDWKNSESTDNSPKRKRREGLSRRERRDVRHVALTNHAGKLKKKRIPSNSRNNHKKPRNWTRQNKTYTNPAAALGWTDEQYDTFIKTGKAPEA